MVSEVHSTILANAIVEACNGGRAMVDTHNSLAGCWLLIALFKLDSF